MWNVERTLKLGKVKFVLTILYILSFDMYGFLLVINSLPNDALFLILVFIKVNIKCVTDLS